MTNKAQFTLLEKEKREKGGVMGTSALSLKTEKARRETTTGGIGSPAREELGRWRAMGQRWEKRRTPDKAKCSTNSVARG